MNIVNIVNFIRSADDRTPREHMEEAVIRQVELAEKYGMPITFLLQPDAVRDPVYTEMIPRKENVEIGMWLELNRTLVLAAGGEWLWGEKEWHWYSGIDLPCGYTPEIRRKMVDIAMAEFKEVFGYYPKTVGSWVLDCVCLEHMEKHYGVTAALNCKDQWGTDSYTLWGGYFNQAFYPTKINAFTPASKKENQINIPIFRMLGSDPVDQYDLDASEDNGQKVLTLEPVYPGVGSDPQWVRWFFDQMDLYPTLSFGYAQSGQENAFGWPDMKKGYELQMEFLTQLEKEGKITFMTVADTAKWYKEQYEITPPSANIAQKGDKDAVWFSNSNYRFGFYADSKVVYIRDIQLFRDDYAERYLEGVCELRSSIYDNVPLVDGYLWSGCRSTKESGVFFEKDGKRLCGKAEIITEECGQGEEAILRILIRTAEEEIKIELCDKQVVFYTDYTLKWVYPEEKSRAEVIFGEDEITVIHNQYQGSVKVVGIVEAQEKSIKPVAGKIILQLAGE